MATITDRVLKVLDELHRGAATGPGLGLDRQLDRRQRAAGGGASGTAADAGRFAWTSGRLATICRNLPARPEELLEDGGRLAKPCDALFVRRNRPREVEVWGLERLPPAPRKPFSRSPDGKAAELRPSTAAGGTGTVRVVAVVSPLGGVGKSYLVRLLGRPDAEPPSRRRGADRRVQLRRPAAGRGRANVVGPVRQRVPLSGLAGNRICEQGGLRGAAGPRLAEKLRAARRCASWTAVSRLAPAGPPPGGGIQERGRVVAGLPKRPGRRTGGACAFLPRAGRRPI